MEDKCLPLRFDSINLQQLKKKTSAGIKPTMFATDVQWDGFLYCMTNKLSCSCNTFVKVYYISARIFYPLSLIETSFTYLSLRGEKRYSTEGFYRVDASWSGKGV